MPFILKVVTAPNPLWMGKVFSLDQGENLAGRVAPPCQIHLDGTKVSKIHCVFLVEGDEVTVKDKKSANGVFVGGKRRDELKLRDKDRIVIGEFILEVNKT